jgi:hypothetical protein
MFVRMFRAENGELVSDGFGSPEMAADWLLGIRKLCSGSGAFVVAVAGEDREIAVELLTSLAQRCRDDADAKTAFLAQRFLLNACDHLNGKVVRRSVSRRLYLTLDHRRRPQGNRKADAARAASSSNSD